MSLSKELIKTLSKEDRREFKTFIHRLKQKSGRKDLDLFNLYTDEDSLKPKELRKQLGYSSNNAFQALNKRLYGHLVDFILSKGIQNDSTSTAQVLEQLNLARYCFDKRVEKLAWKCLKRAEELALKFEHYDLLVHIFNLQIEHIDSDFAEELDVILGKRKTNKIKLEEDERIIIASGLIKKRLKEVRIKGVDKDFDRLMDNILVQFDLSEDIFNHPRVMLKMVEMARSTVLNKRDYLDFEPFILKQYKKLKFNDFDARHLNVKLTYLYLIAHVMYRNKKFQESQKYLADLYAEMLISKKSFYNKFYPKYTLLLAATLTFTGEVDKAIKVLEDSRKGDWLKCDFKHQLNIIFNLAVYYFLSEKYKKASRLTLELPHSDSWYEKIMGKEWVLRKNTAWMLLQLELDNFDLAESKIKYLEKTYKDLFAQKKYSQVKPFLNLVRWYIDDPNVITTKEFYNSVQESFDWIGVEREDLLNLTFYSWMKSKMQGRRFYYILLEVVDV